MEEERNIFVTRDSLKLWFVRVRLRSTIQKRLFSVVALLEQVTHYKVTVAERPRHLIVLV